jgi:hypothetical protein
MATADNAVERLLFRRLVAEAKRRVLFVSPPYHDSNCERAFLSGYETALRDISRGYLDAAFDED